jgi:hypothetical protein
MQLCHINAGLQYSGGAFSLMIPQHYTRKCNFLCRVQHCDVNKEYKKRFRQYGYLKNICSA